MAFTASGSNVSSSVGSTGADPASQSVLGMGLAGLRVGFRHPNPTEVLPLICISAYQSGDPQIQLLAAGWWLFAGVWMMGANLNLSRGFPHCPSLCHVGLKTWRTGRSGAVPGKEDNKPATAGVGLMQALDLSRTALLKSTVLPLSGCLAMIQRYPMRTDRGSQTSSNLRPWGNAPGGSIPCVPGMRKIQNKNTKRTILGLFPTEQISVTSQGAA